jgi:hypothetical protein
VLWKLLTSIIGRCLNAAISFHGAFYGFQPGWGTTTAIIDAKLFQLLTLMQVPIFEISIDFKKAYDTAQDQGGFHNSLNRARRTSRGYFFLSRKNVILTPVHPWVIMMESFLMESSFFVT